MSKIHTSQGILFRETHVCEAKARSTAKLVHGVLEGERRKSEAFRREESAWKKHKRLANLERKFPLSLVAKEHEERFYIRERVKTCKPKRSYVINVS